ncbi:MAG: hypothetical protein KDB90_15170 [Planctomycetes bacterium]|nr:hypothetical protein [Planctomycetota bacterium]
MTGLKKPGKDDTTPESGVVLENVCRKLDGFDRLRIAAGLFRRRYRMLSLKYGSEEVLLRVHSLKPSRH